MKATLVNLKIHRSKQLTLLELEYELIFEDRTIVAGKITVKGESNFQSSDAIEIISKYHGGIEISK